ncbi:MAG: SPOR domain-containing protein [Rhodobacteraceae bacterium]|nr:SPOR domain-containing protein [Paracoccaceae bacterium]
MRDKLSETLKKKLWEEYGERGSEEDRPLERRAHSRNIEEPTAKTNNYMQWVGAALSLALVVAVVYWVFELGRRDATEVPVIQAMAGEARELPENSGGPEVDNQGLQVNEVLGSDTTAPVEPETTLAPPPQRVVAEDVTPPVETTPTPLILVPVEPLGNSTLEGTAETAQPSQLPPSLPGADPEMARPERRVQAAPLSENADILSEAIANAILEATTGVAPAPATAPEAAPSAPLPAASFVGEKMIQLGAYDDEASANRDYDVLLEDNQDLMGRLVRFVERREAGGRVFYRLRARGFTNMEEAADMCSALLARSVQCIAVTAR